MSYDLSQLGWDDSRTAEFAPLDRSDSTAGRVLRADRGVCTVLDASGLSRASVGAAVLIGAAGDPARLPCAGDWVVLRRWPDRRTTIECLLPRRTALIRRTSDKDASGQVLAANMDMVAVLEPIHPQPDDARIERLLALAWESGAQPVLVLSKADTAARPEAITRQLHELAPGVRVIALSVQRGDGLAELRELAGPGRTLALLGRSGAGKSSLVNALAGTTVMPVQEIRRADGKGRHTTAYRNMVLIPCGGAVIDTPGIRGVGLLDTAKGLAKAFAEVTGLAAECRFRDCRHESEPGCAVVAALAGGALAPRRLESFRKLRREVEVESARRAARLAELGARHKARH
ncbi:MAG: ribosome biosis GTPase / thiamine phosphate phosphatase [Actinoplanes sp.]|nr:ribosome biosis GTPase / thiamine phosphate phosphatase [Actinoplanes sp.]